MTPEDELLRAMGVERLGPHSWRLTLSSGTRPYGVSCRVCGHEFPDREWPWLLMNAEHPTRSCPDCGTVLARWSPS